MQTNIPVQTLTMPTPVKALKDPIEKVEKKLSHYLRKAISEYNLIEAGDRVMVCLSGGKDSFTLLMLLKKIQQRTRKKFEIFSFTLDQSQPGWDDSALRAYLDKHEIPFEVLKRDTYSVVKRVVPEGQTYCGLCSRLRRGNIYAYAKEHGFNKIALGHHRDDLLQSMLMGIFYNGEIRSMPPKLLSRDGQIVIRPLVYCQESDIRRYADLMAFPLIPCTLCGSQENLARVRVKRLIQSLAADNPKIPSNMLRAIQNVRPRHLMDKRLWDFKDLENKLD